MSGARAVDKKGEGRAGLRTGLQRGEQPNARDIHTGQTGRLQAQHCDADAVDHALLAAEALAAFSGIGAPARSRGAAA
ncbi:hypothetical protein DQK91_22965, partial [Oceanidesulfovibrio marinus]